MSEPPFSQVIAVAGMARLGQSFVLNLLPEQRDAIAPFLGLASIEALTAKLTLVPRRNGIVDVAGEVQAKLHQICSVSLEPFPSAVAGVIDGRFAPPEKLGPISKAEVERRLSDEDPPEPLLDGGIDIGQLIVEALALALDAFPRKPGLEMLVLGDNDLPQSPFAALAVLKKPTLS